MAEKHIYMLSMYCVTCFPLPAEGLAAIIKPENLHNKTYERWTLETRATTHMNGIAMNASKCILNQLSWS
jgi:hypothetical protein